MRRGKVGEGAMRPGHASGAAAPGAGPPGKPAPFTRLAAESAEARPGPGRGVKSREDTRPGDPH